MTVLLTGGTGFLGGAVARELADAGLRVRMLVRTPAAAADSPPGADLAIGDMTDEQSLRRAVSGCRAVLHLAAFVKRWAPERSLFDRVNVEGAARLFDLAQAAGVAKIVYCSSFLALGPTDGVVGDEDTVHDGRPRNDYERTKRLADDQARRRQAAGAPLVVVYPGVVYGPGRVTDGNVMAVIAQRLLDGRFPGTIGPGDRRWCFAFVDDVARGLTLALDRARPGSRYVLGGENATVAAALELVAAAAGVAAPRRRIPYSVAAGIGWLQRRWAGLTGAAPTLTDEEVAIYRHEWAYSSARAVHDLGYTITPLAEGIGRLVAWLVARRKNSRDHVPSGAAS